MLPGVPMTSRAQCAVWPRLPASSWGQVIHKFGLCRRQSPQTHWPSSIQAHIQAALSTQNLSMRWEQRKGFTQLTPRVAVAYAELSCLIDCFGSHAMVAHHCSGAWRSALRCKCCQQTRDDQSARPLAAILDKAPIAVVAFACVMSVA